MTTLRTTVIALSICMALPAWGQQYLLYAPQAVPSGQKANSQEGILVQEIKVQKGDTLYGISRKFSGHGMYFPQILLFNSIKNPHRIYPGLTLRIPVSQNAEHHPVQAEARPSGAAQKQSVSGERKIPTRLEALSPMHQPAAITPTSAPSAELSLSDLKAIGRESGRMSLQKRKSALHSKKNLADETAAPPASVPLLPAEPNSPVTVTYKESEYGRKLFKAAVKAYQQEDCRTALDLLDRYLADNSASSRAADANLYKAECYMKLSAQ